MSPNPSYTVSDARGEKENKHASHAQRRRLPALQLSQAASRLTLQRASVKFRKISSIVSRGEVGQVAKDSRR